MAHLEEEGTRGVVAAGRPVQRRTRQRQRSQPADGAQLPPVQHQRRLRPLRQAPCVMQCSSVHAHVSRYMTVPPSTRYLVLTMLGQPALQLFIVLVCIRVVSTTHDADFTAITQAQPLSHDWGGSMLLGCPYLHLDQRILKLSAQAQARLSTPPVN